MADLILTSELIHARVIIEDLNERRARVNYDFAYGQFLAVRTFFDEMNDLQNQMLQGHIVQLGTGQPVDTRTPGGLLGLQIYMEAITSRKETMEGLAKLGLNTEKQLWKLQ